MKNRCIGVVSALFLLCFTNVSAEVETPVVIPYDVKEKWKIQAEDGRLYTTKEYDVIMCD